MTRTTLRGVMSRRKRMRRRLIVAVAAMLLALLLAPAGSVLGAGRGADDDTAPAPGEARILVRLHEEGAHRPVPIVSFSLVFNPVVMDDEGQTRVQAPLPRGSALHAFAAYPDPDAVPEPETMQETDMEGDWAVARWGDDGPAPGTNLPMRLDAVTEIGPSQGVVVTWDRLHFELTSVRVLLPTTYAPEGDDGHRIERVGPFGREIEWNVTQHPDDALRFTIRPMATTDPSLSAPPPGWTAFVVIAALALVSGSLWWWGKKADERRKRREQERLRPR